MKKLMIGFSLICCTLFSVNNGITYANVAKSTDLDEAENQIDGYELTIEDDHMIYTITDDESSRQMNESLKAIQNKMNKGRVPTYEYDYVYGAISYPNKSGVMGNQSPGGLRVNGGVWWTSEGGPTSSLSVSFSTGVVSVGISFGNVTSSTSGGFLRFPDAVNYYRAYNDKTMKVQQVAVYGTPIAGGSRRFLYYVYPTSTYRNDVYAVRQNS